MNAYVLQYTLKSITIQESNFFTIHHVFCFYSEQGLLYELWGLK